MTLTRQQRRHIERQLRKLLRRNACSICGSPFRHNTQTAGGLDARGTVVLAGACCTGKVAATFTMGFYSDHQIDFPCSSGKPNVKPTARIADAIALYQNVITETDKVVDDIGRRSGVDCALQVNLSDDPWKDDDRIRFEQNPTRAHRMRLPFPGEYDAEALDTSPGHVLRQSSRRRCARRVDRRPGSVTGDRARHPARRPVGQG
jgi:hypothetical protein